MINPMHRGARHNPKRSRWIVFVCAILAAMTFASPVMGA
jgi:hypothetical protein